MTKRLPKDGQNISLKSTSPATPTESSLKVKYLAKTGKLTFSRAAQKPEGGKSQEGSSGNLL
jgi:hypothetical protein